MTGFMVAFAARLAVDLIADISSSGRGGGGGGGSGGGGPSDQDRLFNFSSPTKKDQQQ
jgi:hypothetical protein